jgi:hypothetical protein
MIRLENIEILLQIPVYSLFWDMDCIVRRFDVSYPAKERENIHENHI